MSREREVTIALKVQNISFAKFVYRFTKFLSKQGTISRLKAILSMRVEDQGSACDFLEANAETRGDATAIRYEDQFINWAEFNARANQWAHYLKSKGLVAGDAIAINMENRPELLIGVMGALKLGVIAGMINTGQRIEALAHSLRLVNPKMLLVGSECLDNMETVSDLLNDGFADRLLMSADGDGCNPPAGYRVWESEIADCGTDNLPETRELTLGTPCYYIFTSGTTGLPKASITTNLKFFRIGQQFGMNVMTMHKDDVFYCALPFYHSNALTIAVSSVLMSGATLAIGRKFSASGFFDECRKYQATAFCYIGELLRYLLAQPVRSDDTDHQVQKIIGNGLRPDIWMQFKERFNINRIHEFYGSSEGTTGFVNIFNFDKTCGWAPGAGEIWQIVRYDIDADEPVCGSDGFLTALGVGETGLLLMKVSEQYPFDGYTDSQASEKKLLRNVFEEGDCWFNTGDMVERQPFGHIQFGDRVGDTFRWQGENVATTEIESAIMQWPGIEDAVVYGVQAPGRDGRCGMMHVTLQSGTTLDFNGLADRLRESLPTYAVPRFLRIGRDVDLTGTFKFQKSKLKQEAYDNTTIKDELYLLPPSEDTWQPITDEVKQRIDAGDILL